IDDTEDQSKVPAELAECLHSNPHQNSVRSRIDCPLTVNGEFRGVVSIRQSEGVRRWTEDEILLVESVAAQLATGVAQAELFEIVARAKKEWESTFDAMSDGIFIFDKAGRLIRVNRAGAAMENTQARSLLGHQCCDILRTDAETVVCVVEQAIRQSE